MKTAIFSVLKDIYDHKNTYILRATVLQIGVTGVGAFLLSLLFRVILVSSDLPGVTTDNVQTFLASPFTLMLLLVYLFILAFLVYLELSLLVEVVEHKEERLSLSFRRFWDDGRAFCQTLSHGHFLAFMAYLVLTIPFLQLLFSSALMENLYILKFISGELSKTVTGRYLYSVIYGLLAYLNLRLIYTLPLTMVSRGQRFGKNMVDSWQLTRGKKIFKLFGLVLAVGALFAILFCLSFVALEGAALLEQMANHFWLETLLLAFVQGLAFVSRLLFKLVFLSYLLRLLGRNMAEQAPRNATRKRRSLLFLSALLVLIGGVYFVYQVSHQSQQPVQNIQVIAHRGLVSQGVENSLEALEAAAKTHVDYVEMDVIFSQDGKFMVSHDDNLKRLTGKEVFISQSKAGQIDGMKIRQNGYVSHLVTFDAYVKKAKELGVKLLVELKPTGTEPENYVSLFVAKMRELGVSQAYQVMSLDLPTIEAVKKIAPEIEVGYCISLQIGDFTSQKVDFYAIEDFSYNEWLAARAHEKGKKLYVWTINDRKDMKKYLQSSSDAIITDYPDEVAVQKSDLVTNNSYLDYFLNLANLD